MEKQEKKFKYYQAVETEEHYLFSIELAQAFQQFFGWGTKNGTAPIACISAYLKKKAKDRHEAELYYETRFGLKRVYPKGTDDISNLCQLLNKQYFATRKRIQKVIIGKKTFTLQMTEETAEQMECPY